jgi:putative flippase GtrA
MIDATAGRYALSGAANTAIGFGAIVALQQLAGLPPTAANAGGYAIGLATGYLLHRGFAFRSRRGHAGGVPAFLAGAAACYGLNLLVLWGVLHGLGAPALLAQASAVLAYALGFYLLNRYVVFAERSA